MEEITKNRNVELENIDNNINQNPARPVFRTIWFV